ncbi:MAG: hypothetical protein ABS54_06145 [Hyphomicrobium sp. SCN 65-11]|nr:MAG: hypothetical protein ABS54_06145 [Hyphomicrobium sp. SCN 65-11]
MTTKSFTNAPIIISSRRKSGSRLGSIEAGNPGKPAPRRIREEGSTAAVTHYVDTRWPGIGGEELVRLPERAFLDPEFAEAYQSGHVAYVYVAGSGDTLKAPDQPTGLHGLARRFALPLFKISATGAENALARIADLNLERYAGMYRAQDGLACDPGYDNWRLVLIHPSRMPLQGAPVEARPRVIRIMLPSGLSLIAFEKELHQRLSPAALGTWIASPAGRWHCADLGLDPREAMRLTGYNTGEGERVSRADELYIFKPRLDGGRLLTIVERIVHDYVVRDVTGQRPSWGWVAPNQGYRSNSADRNPVS